MNFTSDPTTIIATLSAATYVLVEVIKRINVISDRFLPALSILIGVGLGIVYKVDVLLAVLIGASACGIYDLGKKTVAGK